MQENKKKKDNNGQIIINKEDLITWVLTSILVIAVVIMLGVLIKGFTTERANKQAEQLSKGTYKDTALNYIVTYPSAWSLVSDLGNVDKDGNEITNLEHIESVIKETTDESKFDMEKHTLTDEVVSIMLVKDQGADGYNQFMTLSFKANEGLQGEEWKEKASEVFSKEIESSGVKSFEVIKKEIDENGGLYLEGEAKVIYTKQSIETENKGNAETSEEEKVEGETAEIEMEATVYYAEYITVIGKNVATALIGSNVQDTDLKSKVTDLVGSILINQ